MGKVALQIFRNAKLLSRAACCVRFAKMTNAYSTEDNRFNIHPNQVAKPFRQRRFLEEDDDDDDADLKAKVPVSLRRNRGKVTEAIRHDAVYLSQNNTPSDPTAREYTRTWNEFSESAYAKAGARKQYNPNPKTEFDN